jgi:hypothetical protein
MVVDSDALRDSPTVANRPASDGLRTMPVLIGSFVTAWLQSAPIPPRGGGARKGEP